MKVKKGMAKNNLSHQESTVCKHSETPGSRKAVKSRKPGVMAHTYNPSTEEEGRSPRS